MGLVFESDLDFYCSCMEDLSSEYFLLVSNFDHQVICLSLILGVLLLFSFFEFDFYIIIFSWNLDCVFVSNFRCFVGLLFETDLDFYCINPVNEDHRFFLSFNSWFFTFYFLSLNLIFISSPVLGIFASVFVNRCFVGLVFETDLY